MKRPVETPLARSLPATVPFVGPEAIERATGRNFAARLGANESVFGPSPKVLEVIRTAAPESWMYGDPECHDLRHALAASLGIEPCEVVIGEGIDGLLGLVVRLYVGAGDAVVTSDGAYPTFNYHVAGFGGRLIKTPYVEDREDLASLLGAAHDHQAKLVYLANPDNPMGSWHSGKAVEHLLQELPEGCLLVLDEAYAEFAPEDAVPRIDVTDPRVIRMRTFSKAYGLAGLRVGYAFGEADLVRGFDKVRNHFGQSRIGQAASLVALEDQHWVAHVRRRVEEARERIAEIAIANGLRPLPSATNFVTIDCGADAAFAKAVLEGLVQRGIFVRMPFAAPGNRCIRISAGQDADLIQFAEMLPKALKAARGG